MKNNLLKAFCCMIFSGLMQSNAEGMDISKPDNIVAIEEQVTRVETPIAAINEAISNRNLVVLFPFLLRLVKCLPPQCLPVDLGERSALQSELLEFTRKNENVVEQYPSIFGKGSNSLISILHSSYDAKTWTLRIEMESYQNIKNDYDKMLSDGIRLPYCGE